ncbi:MAG: hypothetical protein IKR09_01960 [Alphaproteobacteria bacterium]|nr:hypothetical protein [Alphaproteobacteria bacterium]
MAEEKIDRNEAEIQENIVSEEVKTPDAEERMVVPVSEKTAGKYLFLILIVLIVAGLFGAPQSRKVILEKSRQALAALHHEEEKAEIAAKPQEISTRLEQLENAREFENAEVIVATVEPPVPAVSSDPAYKALAGQQKALLAEIERLRVQLAQVRSDTAAEIKRVKENASDSQQFENQFAAVYAREDGLERQLTQESIKINRLEKNKADASAVLSLMTRMDAAEQKLRVSNMGRERAVALLLAVYQLREAALSGNAFTTELQSALALADSFPRIAGYLHSLSDLAAQGVPTKASLIRSFGLFADQAVLSEEISDKTDWFHQALNALKKLVVIRKTTVADDDPSTQNVLARANAAVQDQDLSEAVLILKDLKGKAAVSMQQWVKGAEAYLSVKKAVNEIISATLGVAYVEQLKGE